MKSEFGIINENNDPVFIYVGEEPLAQIFDGDISVCFDEERPQTGNDVVSLDSNTKVRCYPCEVRIKGFAYTDAVIGEKTKGAN